MKRVAVLLLGVAALAGLASAQYCQVSSCKGEVHTMCNKKEVNKCGKTKFDSGLTQDEKNRIVSLHNKLRQKVASGSEKQGAPGPQPAATKMNNLAWDEELAKIAQHWADLCNFEHDKCRNRANGEYIGQNLAISGTTGDIKTIQVESLVQGWYDEVKFFAKDRAAKPFDGKSGVKGEQVGHYTQFVWADTNKIGCGASKYIDDGFKTFYLVCNYGPGGNIIGQQMYPTSGSSVEPKQSSSPSKSKRSPSPSKPAVSSSPSAPSKPTGSSQASPKPNGDRVSRTFIVNGRPVHEATFNKMAGSQKGASPYVKSSKTYYVNGKAVDEETYKKIARSKIRGIGY